MNGIILVDKPQDWTSFDVIAKLKGVLHERRLGHAGTLDPLATGLLVVFAGRATRAVEYAEAQTKRYIAGIKLGVSTDTQDITGNVISQSTSIPSPEQFKSATASFIGNIEQIPPMYSAIKVNGQRLYDIARKGSTVDRKPRAVKIFSIDIIDETEDGYLLDVVCSKGTYIRTLCNDIGEKLGCGACMCSLRRVASGAYSVDNAHSVEEIIKLSDGASLEQIIMPVDSLFGDLPKITVNDELERKIRCGNQVRVSGYRNGDNLVYSENGEFLMLGRIENGILFTVKNFFEVK